MAASKTEISDYNSLMAPWHGHALGEDVGVIVTGAGIERQFPFPSLKKPAAHETDANTERGIHPPAPSDARLSGHLGDEIADGVSVVNGTHPPYPSDSHPSAQDTITVFGIQFPFPSLYALVGQTYGVTRLGVSERQSPFPSLVYPDPQMTGIDDLTQFPNPSAL